VDDERSTLLVVEDDTATRTFLADNLTADGYELLVADCARDGLRLLRQAELLPTSTTAPSGGGHVGAVTYRASSGSPP